MRKITQDIVSAWKSGNKRTVGNTMTDGRSIWLHGNKIAERRIGGGLYITNAGWFSTTTKERLNALPGVSISQRDWKWYLNGKQWDGNWVKVADYQA